MVLVLQPKAVSETDDLELNALMERVARENKEVSGELFWCFKSSLTEHTCHCRRRGIGRGSGRVGLAIEPDRSWAHTVDEIKGYKCHVYILRPFLTASELWLLHPA